MPDFTVHFDPEALEILGEPDGGAPGELRPPLPDLRVRAPPRRAPRARPGAHAVDHQQRT